MEQIALIRVVQDHYDGHSNVFLDTQGHLGEVHCHLGAFGTFRNAREASGAQRCELKKKPHQRHKNCPEKWTKINPALLHRGRLFFGG